MKLTCVSLILAFSIMSSGCGKKAHSDEDEAVNVKATVAVKSTLLERGNMPRVVETVGKVDALRKQKLFAPLAGRVTALTALEGASVTAGEVLAVIQTKESQAAIAGAEAILHSAKTPEERAEAQKALDLARSTENSVPIRASFNGTVATRSISEGEFVCQGKPHIDEGLRS